MGTCSYILTGTEQGMGETFGSTCHGAVRLLAGLSILGYYLFLFFMIRVGLCLEPNLDETWTTRRCWSV